eukprot:GEMP01054470.1.p1 GENE.GEMP01054470.1~~GEMP01054470.1.p1  ORF type:complete len:158 (-),score=3.78 GEMP01054470.1:1057-1530(-)
MKLKKESKMSKMSKMKLKKCQANRARTHFVVLWQMCFSRSLCRKEEQKKFFCAVQLGVLLWVLCLYVFYIIIFLCCGHEFFWVTCRKKKRKNSTTTKRFPCAVQLGVLQWVPCLYVFFNIYICATCSQMSDLIRMDDQKRERNEGKNQGRKGRILYC